MKRNDSSPESYRNDVTGEQREMLDAIRAVIFEVAPKVEETIEYGMLSYPGLACLAAQKHHVSLYVSPQVLEEYRAAFSGVNCGKSCLRFRNHSQLDLNVLRKLLKQLVKTSKKS
jgi:uncharacterized protein YdhG (YjbR/CyaY superfamily)